MNGGGTDAQKRRAGESAAEAVEDGMVVGLGTGSTAAHAIRAIGREVAAGLDIAAVPTSYQSRRLAREAAIPLTTLADATPDLAIDGADQVLVHGAGAGGSDDPGQIVGASDGAGATLVKGGGAAHAREKIVDAAADRLLVVVDPTKVVDALDHPVPVEVLPDAEPTVAAAVADLGGEPRLRAAERKDGPVVTDNGNLVLDCDFGTVENPAGLAAELSALPGAVEHGLFVDLADEIHCGTDEGAAVRSV